MLKRGFTTPQIRLVEITCECGKSHRKIVGKVFTCDCGRSMVFQDGKWEPVVKRPVKNQESKKDSVKINRAKVETEKK